MLLELHQLSESLKTSGITAEQQDDRLVGYSLGKPVFRVKITLDGKVCSVDRISADDVPHLIKYRVSKGGSQESIPGFNVPPLLEPKENFSTVADVVGQFAKRLKRPPKGDTVESRQLTLDQLMAQCTPGWDKKNKAIAKCLTTAVEVVSGVIAAGTEENRNQLAPLAELLDRVRRVDPSQLRDQLQEHVRRLVLDPATTSETAVECLSALIRRKLSKAGNDPGAVQLMLELADWDGTPANHQSVWQVVRSLLVSAHRSRLGVGQTESPSSFRDPFGVVGELNTKKLPQVPIPALGTVILRSHAKSKPCQRRYGMIEGDSFPLTRELPASLADALAHLTADKLEGTTFREITEAGGFNRKALLLAYPDPMPSQPPALARVMARTGQTTLTPSDARFAAAAGVVVGQIQDLIQKTPAAQIQVFVLAKGKKPPTKLLLSRQISAARIVKAVGEWREAATNLPPVFVKKRGEDGKSQWFQCDDTPYPSDLARCMNRVWQRRGERAESVSVFDFGSALTLLLDEGRLPNEVAAEGLRLAVSQWADLLLAMGQAATLGRVCPFSTNDQLLLPPILGLLLFKLGHRKEVYMKAMPYWLGRFLAVADKVHRNYCDRERDGVIPKGPLLGNSVMAECLENPQAGYAELAMRVPPYQRVSGVELSREWAEIIQHIDVDSLPNRLTDEGKAQLLLGYLARPDLLLPSETITPSEPQS